MSNLAQKKAAVFYITQNFPETGKKAYYYVEAKRGMEDKIISMMNQSDEFNLEQYGTILTSGYGEPSIILKQDMARQYDLKYFEPTS